MSAAADLCLAEVHRALLVTSIMLPALVRSCSPWKCRNRPSSFSSWDKPVVQCQGFYKSSVKIIVHRIWMNLGRGRLLSSITISYQLCHSRVILCWYFSITLSSSVHVDWTEWKNCRDKPNQNYTQKTSYYKRFVLRPVRGYYRVKRERGGGMRAEEGDDVELLINSCINTTSFQPVCISRG